MVIDNGYTNENESATLENPCEKEWIFNENDCFRVSLIYCNFIRFKLFDEPQNFTEAAKKCASLGAHLVIVHSQEEEDFVGKLAQYDAVWLGLTRVGATRNFTWTDNSTMNYQSWYQTRPANMPVWNLRCSYLRS